LAVILTVHLDFPAHLEQAEPQSFTISIAEGLCPTGINVEKVRFSLQELSSRA
jgi:hypothetical protein